MVAEAMWPSTVLSRPDSSLVLLSFVHSWIMMVERLQERMRRKSGQDLGMWEASVRDARKGDGADLSFGNVESRVHHWSTPWHYEFWKRGRG